MRDYLLFAIIIGIVPFILKRPWIGIAAWFWIGLMVPQGHTWGFMRTFPLAMVIGLVTLAALLMNRDRRPIPWSREMILLAVWVGYVTLTSVFAVNPAGAWDFWVKFMKILLITFITPMLVYGEKRIITILLVITASLAFYGFKGGLFAISTGGNHSVLGPPGSYLSGNTYIGLAMLMALPLILVSARLFYRQWVDFGIPIVKRFSRPLGLGLYAVFWLTVISVLATYSRGALLALLVITPFLLWRMKHKWLIASLAILAVGVIGITAPERLTERWQTIETYEEDTSAMQRIQSWGISLNMAKENPVTGMGFGYTNMGYDWWSSYANFEGSWRHVLSPHSIYFGVMAQHGFGGLAIFLLLLAATFLTLNKIRRTAIQHTGQIWLAEYAWALQISLIGYAAGGAFLDVAYFDLYYAFIALVVIMWRELQEAPSPGEAATQNTKDNTASPASPRFPDFVATRTTDQNESK
ncbi:putative O-glycosylation ligase, exosortase A system-associated [Thiohalophilus thiocyanatoxydans]|uniref:Putative O-glycosylation ligase (Exosortase A-associated) n=1 Tax=Thiohalophilus thiocyanatoxydans TaxID=381308 RepID=A0A4R8J0E3_9GAMM|nr:putative O-glycosylation ligase, exosortase A system-associated [Thiohalophilus thiocyanatoxydans]TDY03757.1 putative O-glycosylation ligase (exosortase A-associated) [Thiohalophilus thiocyanatoxydans]